MIIISPGQVFKHTCGYILRNIKKTDIKLPNGKCPQCGRDVETKSVGSMVQEYTTWKLYPPHGMSFKNEMGSEVSIQIPKGRELELFQNLEQQLQQLASAHQGQTVQDPFVQHVTKQVQLASKFSINEEGEIIVSDDGPPEAGPR
jgi:PHP family Zn ribbon phosphoesterase